MSTEFFIRDRVALGVMGLNFEPLPLSQTAPVTVEQFTLQASDFHSLFRNPNLDLGSVMRRGDTVAVSQYLYKTIFISLLSPIGRSGQKRLLSDRLQIYWFLMNWIE